VCYDWVGGGLRRCWRPRQEVSGGWDAVAALAAAFYCTYLAWQLCALSLGREKLEALLEGVMEEGAVVDGAVAQGQCAAALWRLRRRCVPLPCEGSCCPPLRLRLFFRGTVLCSEGTVAEGCALHEGRRCAPFSLVHSPPCALAQSHPQLARQLLQLKDESCFLCPFSHATYRTTRGIRQTVACNLRLVACALCDFSCHLWLVARDSVTCDLRLVTCDLGGLCRA